jgi:hypothetical protein
MMAGGIRPTRNIFRGAKKDMLQKQTTLYLQNMTVSIFFYTKRFYYFGIGSSVFCEHYVNLRVLYRTWNFYTVWETYRLLKKDSVPEFIAHSCTHKHPVLEKLKPSHHVRQVPFSILRSARRSSHGLFVFFFRRVSEAHDNNCVVVYSKEATVISFSNLVYNSRSVRSFDIVKASVYKLRNCCIKALIKIR